MDQVIYEGSWEWQEAPNPGLYFKGSDLEPFGYLNTALTSHPDSRGLYIEIHTSEPMQSLNLSRCAPDPFMFPFASNTVEISSQ